jgi:hypothetical protein
MGCRRGLQARAESAAKGQKLQNCATAAKGDTGVARTGNEQWR